MAYRQTAYNTVQGINGKYTIAEIGCFITSFCNLLERFGQTIDPPTINSYLRGNNIYIDVDDGIVDDVGWSTITRVNGNVHATYIKEGAYVDGVQQPVGFPSSNNAIVKFAYRSPRSGHYTTHFSVMADASQQLILDSWDGVVKHSGVYGIPVAYAIYDMAVAQAVTPVQPQAPTPAAQAPEKPTFTLEPNFTPKDVVLKIDAKLWNLDTRDWNYLVNNPVSQASKGTVFNAQGKLYQMFGGAYYLPDKNVAHGYNTVDCEDYVPLPTHVDPPLPTELDTVITQPVENSTSTVVTSVQTVPVKIIPAELKFEQSFRAFPNKATITLYAQEDFDLIDYDNDQPTIPVTVPTMMVIGGEFTSPDGVECWRSVKSILSNHWYGIPKEHVTKDPVEAFMDDTYSDEDFAKDVRRAKHTETAKDKFAALLGTLSGLVDRVLRRNKNKGSLK